ncbi:MULTISPECIES: prephenate dehydrogenase [Sphingobacterium]|jgi:prephenate dehydrogenase|uniref:Prephenate dehydrogenase n=4 Tax=Sphingobacterium TaxID=28453 RepID=A0ACD5C1M5_9SPHI|nr:MULTISPECIES: prephenate dehydrogenase [Sphingobacterium]APU98306.1 prephenate dehydrogenase [Sphingobacterium sp. B29]MBB1647037.1 prephenate dehydrogenase [Sphingobacterium sp. UME9]MCS4163456.1 prephenate dehydrogenase [Sphingobacterium sp. BIGb0116]QMV66639.1 prephenate dehydrogenase [Sphingobacterium paramultivorum]QQT46622.1 prephenate dehydrogenase [Sphingobacterium multivorum]
MNIAIVGVGLIGGSVAIRLKETKFCDKIIGVDKSQKNLDKAMHIGFIDETASLEDAIKSCKVLVLTIPVDAILHVVPQILDLVTDQVVIDMGSTKTNILNKIKDHPNRGRYVAAHPMAGTEYSGPEAAIPGLFKGKMMVYVEAFKTDEDAFEIADAITDQLEMRSCFMNADEHDVHTAYVSHISHLTSFALALTVLEKEKSQGRIFELAGSGFESTVRLAKSSPDMWTPIFKQNRENVLEVLEEHIKQLQSLHDSIATEDYDKLHKLITRSNKIKRIIK